VLQNNIITYKVIMKQLIISIYRFAFWWHISVLGAKASSK